MFDFFLGIWTFGYIWDITSNYLKLKFFRSQNKEVTPCFFGFLKDPLTTHPWNPQEQLHAAVADAAQAESEKVQGGRYPPVN